MEEEGVVMEEMKAVRMNGMIFVLTYEAWFSWSRESDTIDISVGRELLSQYADMVINEGTGEVIKNRNGLVGGL